MKKIFFVLVSSFFFNSCYSQKDNIRNNRSIEVIYINKFIEDSYDDNDFFKNDTLNVLGYGVNFLGKNKVYVKYIQLDDIKNKMKSLNKFSFITIENPYFSDNKYIKTSFGFLTAFKNKEDYRITKADNSTSDYCIFFNKKTNKYEVKWCGRKID